MLYELIIDCSRPRPAEALAQLALASLQPTINRYHGYNPAERDELMLEVVDCIRTGRAKTKPDLEPKPGPEPIVKRELRGRQREQSAQDRERAKDAPPMDPQKAKRTRAGRPKSVAPRVNEDDRQIVRDALNELLQADGNAELQGQWQALGTPWDDPQVKGLVGRLCKQLGRRPQQVKRYVKDALDELPVRYAPDLDDSAETPSTPSLRSTVRTTAARPTVTERPKPKKPPAPVPVSARPEEDRRAAVGDEMWAKLERASNAMKPTPPPLEASA